MSPRYQSQCRPAISLSMARYHSQCRHTGACLVCPDITLHVVYSSPECFRISCCARCPIECCPEVIDRSFAASATTCKRAMRELNSQHAITRSERLRVLLPCCHRKLPSVRNTEKTCIRRGTKWSSERVRRGSTGASADGDTRVEMADRYLRLRRRGYLSTGYRTGVPVSCGQVSPSPSPVPTGIPVRHLDI